MKLHRNYIITAILLSVSGLVGCGAAHDFSEVHDATLEMNGRTERMADTSEELNGTSKSLDKKTDTLVDSTGQVLELAKGMSANTNHMRGTADEIKLSTETAMSTVTRTYLDLRQGSAMMGRNDALKSMNDSKALEGKMTLAGAYHWAFEFQLWKGEGSDDQATREDLYHWALREYFFDISRYIDFKSMSTDPISSKNELRNLLALSAAMDEINTNQRAYAKKHGFEPLSVYSLIMGALAKRAAVESGQIQAGSLKDFERDVLGNEKLAVYMLELRANFLPMMVLTQISDIATSSLFNQIRRYLFASELKLDGVNLVQLGAYTEFFKSANDLRNRLQALGYAAKPSSIVLRFYRNLKIPEARGLPGRVTEISALYTEIERFRR